MNVSAARSSGSTNTNRKRLLLPFAVVLTMVSVGSAAAGDATPVATPTPGCAGVPAQGLVLLQSLPEGEDWTVSTAVITPDGTEVRRFIMPYAADALANRRSSRVLVQAAQDKGILLVDLQAGTAQLLDFPGDEPPDVSLHAPQFRASRGTRFALLGDQTMQRAYLVDLETGSARELGAAINDPPLIVSGAVLPGDEQVLLWTGSELWLVPTDAARPARDLGGEHVTYGVRLRADSQAVLFSREMENGTTEVAVQPLDGGEPTTIATGASPLVAWPLPRTDRVLLGHQQSLSLLDPASGKERPLLDRDQDLITVLVGPAGRHALAAFGGDSGRTWALIDLQTGRAAPLDVVQGMNVEPMFGHPRWVAFSHPNEPVLYGFDLQTGTLSAPMRVEGDTLLLQPQAFSADGRYALFSQFSNGPTAIWLIDNADGEARRLGEGRGQANAAFSPDGCWVAYSEFARDGSRRAVATWLLSVEGGEPMRIGGRIVVAWVAVDP